MSRNATRGTLGLAVAAAALLVLLTGCAPTVALHPAAHATNAKCAAVVAQLPATVSTLGRRETNAQGTGAWGTPADILLRCGVPVPDPTSTLVCIEVDGIYWLYNDKSAAAFVFTTYGRNPAVAVTVNAKNPKADGNAALTDLAPALSAAIPQDKHRCISVSQQLQGGEPVTPSTKTPAPTPTPTPMPTN